MKSAFAAALIAVVQAVSVTSQYGLGHGAYGQNLDHAGTTYAPVTQVVLPAKEKNAASAGYQNSQDIKKTTDWDAWGRDQDLAIDESYGRTSAKSYRAESYDEWDNTDNDSWGAQAWGKDRDLTSASSQEHDASTSEKKGEKLLITQADWNGAAQRVGYDNDEWAKAAYGQDIDSRWGKSYDSVKAQQYDNEHYAREVRADDDYWAEDYDTAWYGKADAYAGAASADTSTGKGWGRNLNSKNASAGSGKETWQGDGQDWDAFGRDQDFHEKVSYDTTRAKSYEAESYDEWDNTDNDKWGAQSWGKDRDLIGTSSYGLNASALKKTNTQYNQAGAYGGYGAAGYGQAYGKSDWGGYGAGNAGAAYDAGKVAYDYGQDSTKWEGASAMESAAINAADNDEYAKQGHGSDTDTRYGKSYDMVKARSYNNEKYARWLQADDDVWGEDYDQLREGDTGAYGKAASAWGPGKATSVWGYGGAYGASRDAASKAGAEGYQNVYKSDWDSYGRDQDLEVDESYEMTNAKSYTAESYDEWDNVDKDNWGAQAWGIDQDKLGASSYNFAASAGDKNKSAQGYGKNYGTNGYGAQYGAYGAGTGYGNGNSYSGYGTGYGYDNGYNGYGTGYGYGAGAAKGAQAATAYGGAAYQKIASASDAGASTAHAAAKQGYDNDQWAKQAHGTDFDTRWGKSYDFVDANEYNDEQYARKVRADDDMWAEDYDNRINRDYGAYKTGNSRSLYALNY